jgi:serine protease Do
MVEELKGDPAIKSKSTSRAANRLVDYLFKENGFHGTRNDTIDDPSNSYLNEVLDDREGIPLTLSIVYLELARRLGLPEIHGVSLPGRFMVAYEESIPEVENRDKDKEAAGKEKEAVKKKEEGAAAAASTSASVKEVKRQVYLDLFEGGKTLTSVEAEQLIEESTGTEVLDEHRAPATPRAIILRLLHNLTSYAKKPEQAMPYLDLILTVEPESHGDRLQRSLIRARTGDREGARTDLKHLLDAEPEGYDLGKISALYESL